MDLQVQFKGGAALDSVDVLIDSLQDLKPILAEFRKYKRAQVQRLFDSQGDGKWPALDPDTMENRQKVAAAVEQTIRSGAYHTLVRKLTAEKKRAEKRVAHRETGGVEKRKGKVGAYARSMRGAGWNVGAQKVRGAVGHKLLAKAKASVSRYEAQIAEVERIGGGGERGESKEFQKLHERVERAEGRAQEKIDKYLRGELLGQVANSIQGRLEKNALIFEGWGAFHNEGATVGNRARLPKRTFLEWTAEDMQAFARIAKEYMQRKWDKGRAK